MYSLLLTMLHAVRSHLFAVASFLTLVLGVLVFAPGSLLSSPGGPPPLVPQLTGQDTSRARQPLPGLERDPRRLFGQMDSVRRDTTRRDTTRRDTTRRDTTGLRQQLRKGVFSDTTYVVYRDSSARMRHFTPVRRDNHSVEIFPRRTYPLFATPRAGGFRREVTLDSSGSGVAFRETIGGADVKIPVSMPLRDYVKLRLKQERRKLLADEVRKPPVLTAKDDLGSLLSNITQITIPIPPNPIFSIFGKPEVRLNISGAVDIKAGFRNTKSDQTTISRLDQSRNEPDFSQEVQVNVNGTIGDKLNILADWNTRRTFEYENQLKIKYTGYDDEIVQSVEAGNVSLQTPSSFIGSSQALFGVKAKFQMGPLTLTTLASQKKGQIKEVAVSGGAKEQTFEFRAFEYATNHYFVDTVYRQQYDKYYQNDPPIVDGNAQIVEEEVWVQRQGGIPDPNERQGVAFISLPSRINGYDESLRLITDVPGHIETGPFVKLDRSQYELDGDGYIGVVSFNTNVGDQQIVGIAYRRADGTQYGELIRNVGSDSAAIRKPLILKMVKPKNLLSNGPGYAVAWNQLLKNIYPIPGIGRNLKKEGFTLDLFRRVPGGEDVNNLFNEPLLRVFGLDRYTPDGAPAPTGDGQFDFRPGKTISISRAEIIFPVLRPFDDGVARYFGEKGTVVGDTSEYRYKEVYDTTQTFAQQSLRNRWVIRGKAAGEATSRYSLGFNVVEGSVQVLLDGRTLVQNIDYTVDYIIGEVSIKNDKALVPGANLQIKYEQNDLFQLASKTLLGARGDLWISPKTLFGFTIMNLNQQTLSDKVRLGEEPSNNTIFGVDGSTTVDLPFLTRAINGLPLIQTRESSSFKISGEAAYMLPDPNTMKSTIPSDNGEGIAYIDDFEGARRSIPVGIGYTAWTQGSPLADDHWFPGTPDTTKMFAKGKMVWFNRLPTDVRLTDIFPRKLPGNAANDQATVLDFRYYPITRGQFNYSRNLSSTLTRQRNWGALMKPLSVSAINLTKENINFIELWMRVDHAPADGSGKMIIDLGAISEDAIPNRILNSEDLVLSSTPNGVLQDGEDLGLDMLSDAQEQARYADLISLYPELAGDPSGDNYAFNNATVGTYQEDFTRINGTEGNKDGPAGRIPDTEDLNSNGVVDLANSYFEYEISLDTSAVTNPNVVSAAIRPSDNTRTGWVQFRIPVRDFTRTVGSPTQENIEFIRVAFVNATDTIAVRIGDFSLVGNQWQKQAKDNADTTFDVTVVSIEDNPFYESPPGVIRERDKTRPEENVQANEQSLSLVAKGLPDGESRQAVKFYTYKALDLFSYRTMKMFIHGDDHFAYVDENNYDAEMYFRFGLDSLNYYEYRAPVHRGWDPLNDITILFSDVTALKQGRDSANVLSVPVAVGGGPPGSYYRVLGNPSLTQVVYLSIGIENPKGKGTTRPLVGAIWANELRLTSVDNTPGWAYRFDTQLKLADLGSVSFNYSKVDPNFHTLEQKFGSRMSSTSWALNASMAFERFFPEEWAGTSLPFSYSHSEGFVQPVYLPNSDVLVDKAAELLRKKVIQNGGTAEEADRQAQELTWNSQSRRVTDTYAAPTFRINLPSNAWYIRDTFNKLLWGFTYTKSDERSPAVVYRTSWSWNARVAWALTLPPDYFVTPFQKLFDGVWFLDEYKSWKLFFPLTNFSWSVSAARSRDRSLQRTVGSQEIISRNFAASRGFSFSWKLSENGILSPSGDYQLSIESTLLPFETDSLGRQRPFSQIMSDIFFGSRLINFGQDTRYSQRNQFNTRPNIPNILNIKKFLDVTFSYGVDYGWQNTLTRGDLGKSAGFNNNINASMTFRLKQLFDPLWEESPIVASVSAPSRRRTPEAGEGRPADSSAAAGGGPDSTQPVGLGKSLAQLKNLSRVLIKIPFLDFDNVSVTFSQTNSAQNSGIVGGPGFVNFWGKVPFFQESEPRYGPSRLYQLGLISDPSGRLTNFRFQRQFPFFGWDVAPGPRAPGGVLMNSYRQTNRLNFKTSRALWEGARIDLNWSLGWSYNRTQNLVTDSLVGIATVTNTTTTGNVERSFLTFPDVLFLGMFKTGLKEVSKQYAELKNNRDTTVSDEEKLATAFEKGFEALPILSRIFGQYYPRVNWSFRWDGLEKIPLFANLASRVSLDHSYNSSFTRQYQNRPGGGGERTDGERVSYGFAPLVGLNFTFKELWKGNFGANMRYNSTTSFDLATSSRNIVETLSQEISLTASFARRGFEIPFFGLSLNNDVDVSFSYSVTKNSRKTYDVSRLDVNVEGLPLEGSTRTVMEPRIKYVLSARVTASVYYRYTKVAPDDSGSRIPGVTTSEAGLDIHISIQ